MTEEIFIGIDADTVIAPNAIGRMVVHFLDERMAAVAGNAKVGIPVLVSRCGSRTPATETQKPNCEGRKKAALEFHF